MELKDIVHISGKPGLYKIVAHGKANLVVESLDASKVRTSVSVSQRFSVLDDISMFTTEEDIKLREVMVKLNDVVVAGARSRVGAPCTAAAVRWAARVRGRIGAAIGGGPIIVDGVAD